MSAKINAEIESFVRNNTIWENLPDHIKQILTSKSKVYYRYVYHYSLKNQLRYRGNLVSKIFRNEKRYYELLVEESINYLSIFPYHLSDIVTKGLRVTPFNFYFEAICNLLKNDKSYDTLPNFTAADCLRVLGIGRNEYLALISELKTNSSKLFRRPNPMQFLPKFPVKINIEAWWIVQLGSVLESDIKYVSNSERNMIDALIDLGPQTVGTCDYNTVHSLYRKGLIYLDVPVSGDDKICIPPLRNFVMNRVSGDYFENLLYKIFVSADEHMTISELANMLQIDLDTVKHAVSLFCRLGFAKKKDAEDIPNLHSTWQDRETIENDRPQVTPLNYHSLLLNEAGNGLLTEQKSNEEKTTVQVEESSPVQQMRTDNSIEYISSDGNISDFSFTTFPDQDSQGRQKQENQKGQTNENSDLSSEIEDVTEGTPVAAKTLKISAATKLTQQKRSLQVSSKSGKRVAFLFDSTLTAFLMMGNLSPGLKNHAVTMFEVGKLCDESMDSFLAELENVSLLDAEGEGEVSRYFAHAVILRSTIIALRNLLESGLDLLRLECLESLDYKTRNRLLEKKYKYIISAAPLSGSIGHTFSIPFFGQFYKSSENAHIWSKLFYYHISGYGPPSLLLTKGTVLKSLPRLFLGYGKLLVTIIHTDSYVICSENFRNLNEQLKNGCVLIQGYGIRKSGEIRYEAFPFDTNDPLKKKWSKHKAILKIAAHLNIENTCGYVTFVNTGVPDIGCENYDLNVILERPKPKRKSLPGTIVQTFNSNPSNQSPLKKRTSSTSNEVANELTQSMLATPTVITAANSINPEDLQSPMDNSELSITFSKLHREKVEPSHLKTPDENYFAVTPQNVSPSNIYRSDDCNELLAKELAEVKNNNNTDEMNKFAMMKDLVSQNSVEIPIDHDISPSGVISPTNNKSEDNLTNNDYGEDWTILDIHFGVPLFDVDCNTRICEYFVRNLCNDKNLDMLPSINAEMNKKFLKFVKQCLYFTDEDMELVQIGKLFPQPRINLAFENGKVSYWAGK